MPTENRSSNTEMVSELLPCPFCGEKPQITKHHREDIYSFMHRCQILGPISWGFREDQQAHVEKWNARDKPAEQHQGEPVARYSMDQTGCEEPNPDGSWVRYEDLRLADPGEVERLRVEIADLLEENRLMTNANAACGRELVELRAQLAERDALLADIKTKLNGQCWAWPGLIRRIDELSASAEPNAPKCETCNGLGTLPDGEIAGLDGLEFANGPVECVKDCPDCTAIYEEKELAAFQKAGWSKHETAAWLGWKSRAALARQS